MLWPERELGDVLHGPVVVDDKAVVLPVASGPGLALGDHQHRLHREDHPRLEDGVHILSQLKTRLPGINLISIHSQAASARRKQ